MTMPRAGAFFGAFSSSTSACSRIASSSSSMPAPVFADTGMNCASPPYSSGITLFGDELLLHALGIRFGLVDLVDRDDDRHVARLRVRDRFLRLRHDAVVGGDDQDDDVGDFRAARAHRRERLVARRVEERDHALLRLT